MFRSIRDITRYNTIVSVRIEGAFQGAMSGTKIGDPD
jgi:hypothetical protein